MQCIRNQTYKIMENSKHPTDSLRRRRFLLVLPLLVLPFTTLLFWLMGGGQGSHGEARAPESSGINNTLPEASLSSDPGRGKLGYYQQAATDSVKWRERLKKEAYAFGDIVQGKFPGQQGARAADTSQAITHRETGGYTTLATEQATAYRKLEQLQAMIADEPQGKMPGKGKGLPPSPRPAGSTKATDLARLEQLMQRLPENTNADPELLQLNGMLEKILDIQHPERVRDKLRQHSEESRGVVFPVVPVAQQVRVSVLLGEGAAQDAEPGQFLAWEAPSAQAQAQTALVAVVHEKQTVTAGSTVKLRLTGEAFLSGVLLAKDSFVYGVASLQGERLLISVQGIRSQSALIPVALSVYDMDGLPGIRIPGGFKQDAAQESTERALGGIGLQVPHPSLELQAASTGMEAARSLLGKKARQVRVTVNAGYQVFLQNERQP